ncbi:hypothetical protein [Methylobacterium planeticum]|uniref:Uncharacterized protein n=1 Tax=Methylobacterium planeticum TaxID=2615211 RepID=A0A6N6MDA2_9HYPH|nr:hypothetical protein [Methylobacterium planeticum]KAB1068187.1 hypothetical protein F6X51_27135 [Methylobacterium planeticum]
MISTTLEHRLRRLETKDQADLPMGATLIFAPDKEDAERQLAARLANGTHMPHWPTILVTGQTVGTTEGRLS